MEKRKIIIASSSILLFTFLAIFFTLNYSQNFNLTGFATYSSQPASEGKDTYLRQGLDTNFGTDTILRIGKTGGGTEFRSLIEFDISSIPIGDTIISSILTIYITAPITPNNITITAYQSIGNWSELEAGWNNKTALSTWTSAGGDYSREIGSVSANQSGYYNITITSAVRNWVDGTYENYGLLLLSTDASNGDYKEIASSDNPTETYRPQIIIDHIDNAVPTITSIETNSNLLTPTQIGNSIDFTVAWDDLEEDDTRIFVCNTSSIDETGCADKTFCSTSIASTNPATCSYITLPIDNRTTDFYVSACSSTNCSTPSQDSFYVNHIPSILVVQPNGGETLNQSQGNYLVKFNVSDNDSDTLTYNLYYGLTQNSITNPIASLTSTSCSDPDSNTATTNNCSYSWNTTGIYGTYYLTATANDTFTLSNDSSASSFNIRSVVDNSPPEISSITTTSNLYSGKTIYVNATITDENVNAAWIDLNYSSTNITMTNLSSTLYTGNFPAPAVGTYSFQIYADDIIGNTDNSSSQEFSVSKPNATTQNETSPPTALPYHVVKITSQITATNSLKNLYAYLNAPEGFTFLSDYPQNTLLGNLSDLETKTATWFASCPLDEGTYALNTTYTDQYNNQWNSSNTQIQVTSAIGGYEISLAGYPEVETSYNYYVESYFKQNGAYTNADSVFVSIYDAAGSLTAGPASMTQESTGIYNYSYTVGASATEGLWETRVNATKSGTSYYANEFWKVVGGPFDVRDVTVIDASISNLNISFIAENTGGANKDLILTWNLTRTDTGDLLDFGGETFMVPANSERTWYVNPETTYIGQTQITLLGYYSGTEKAGAYKVFSTTSGNTTCGDGICNGEETCSSCPSDCGVCPATPAAGGGGGGGGVAAIEQPIKNASIEISDLDAIQYLTKNMDKTIKFRIKNIGNIDLTNINLDFKNFEPTYFVISPKTINLKSGQESEIEITFSISDFIGERDIVLSISSNEINQTFPITLIVLNMKDYFLREIERLANRINTLQQALEITDKTNLIVELTTCKELLDKTKSSVDNEEYLNAKKEVEDTDKCIDDVKDKSEEKEISISLKGYWVWIITWSLILILITVLIIILYIIYKKIGIAQFIKKNQDLPKKPSQKDYLDEKIKGLMDKLKD